MTLNPPCHRTATTGHLHHPLHRPPRWNPPPRSTQPAATALQLAVSSYSSTGRPRARAPTRISRDTNANTAGRGSSSSIRQQTRTSTPDPSASHEQPSRIPCHVVGPRGCRTACDRWERGPRRMQTQDPRRLDAGRGRRLGDVIHPKSSIKPLSAEVHAALLRLRALGVSFDIDHIARANNKVADALAKAAAEGRPQRGDASIPGVDVGPNPRVQERTWSGS